MPCFQIRYTSPRTDHAITESLEWVTDGGWDADRTMQAFRERYPDAANVQLREVQCS